MPCVDRLERQAQQLTKRFATNPEPELGVVKRDPVSRGDWI
jgi:hypothetical protein